MANKNLTNLALLYDFAAGELDRAINSGMAYSDSRVLKKLNLLYEAAKTMSLVYQIENLRRSQDEDKVNLPDEKVVEDPAGIEAKKNTFNPSSGLSDHKGWTPF